MMARLWRGSAANEKANDYVEHLQGVVFPELSQIDGYRGAYLLRRQLNDGVEFAVLTLWESMDAISKFAGAEAEVAVVAPAAQALLRAFDSTVTHFEIVLTPK
jgi:heme-degrading monooxygenase HmoA